MIGLEAIKKKLGSSVVILPPGGAVETVIKLVSEAQRLRGQIDSRRVPDWEDFMK